MTFMGDECGMIDSVPEIEVTGAFAGIDFTHNFRRIRDAKTGYRRIHSDRWRASDRETLFQIGSSRQSPSSEVS